MAPHRQLFLMVGLLLCACIRSGTADVLQAECLKVSTSEFAGTVKNTIDVVQQVASILSQFANSFGDFRLSNAISDCLDLLEFSSDELSWSVSATQNPKGSYFYFHTHSLLLALVLFSIFEGNRLFDLVWKWSLERSLTFLTRLGFVGHKYHLPKNNNLSITKYPVKLHSFTTHLSALFSNLFHQLAGQSAS